MNIYRVIFLILLVCFMFEDYIKKDKKIYKIIKLFSVLLVVLMVGLRGFLGPDIKNYYNAYILIPNLDNLTWRYLEYQIMEPGYLIVNSIIKTLGIEFWGVLFFSSLITMINLYKFFNYFSNYFFYSLTFYYVRWLFLKDFIQIRNAIASSFLLVSFISLKEKKYKRFIFLILVGCLFHKTVIIGLTLPIFQYFYRKKRCRNIILLVCFILPFVSTKKYLNSILIPIFGADNVYLTGVYSTRESNLVIYYFYIIFMIIYILNRFLKKKYNNQEFLESILGYSLFFNSLFFHFGDLGGRLVSYFNVEYIVEDKFLKIFKPRFLIKTIIILFLLFLFKINFIDRIEKGILPYKTYFQEKLR